MAQAPKKANDAAGDAEAPKKKKKLLLMIALVVGLVAISVGGTVVALKILSPSTHEAPVAEAAPAPALTPAIYYEMKPNFTINFTADGRQRFLQVSVTLLYRDPLLESLLSLHMPAIRNGLVILFSGKNFNELQTPEGKEQLKVESLAVIQALLKKEQDALAAVSEDPKTLSLATVEQVLFTNFVMQ